MSLRLNWITGSVISAVMALGYSVPVSAQAANADKSITIVLSGEPDTLDGCMSSRSVTGRIVLQNITETLTVLDPEDGSITPRLATSWEKIDDKTWRFHLRQGVSFSDGAPFNAETATKAIARTMEHPDLFCENRTKRFADVDIKGVPVDTYTLDIVTSKPEPILPTRMGILALSSPNTPTDKLTWNPIGTGPYVLVDFKPGQEANVTRNEGYWGKKPVVEAARYIWRTESSVRGAMVKVGEADLTDGIAAQDATDPTMDSSFFNSETTYGRVDNVTPPLNDKRIRLALNYAIDRDAIRGTVFPKGALDATQIVGPWIAGHNHDLDKTARHYDPEKARKLVAEAKADGVPVDTQILLKGRIGYYPNVNEFGEALMAMFNAVGLNTKLEMLESSVWSTFNNKPFAADRGPYIMLHQHDNNAGDPVFSVYSKYSCKGSSSGQCVPELDKMILDTAQLSGPERVKAWNEVFRVIYEDLVTDVFMYHMVGFTRVGKRIDFTPNISINSMIPLEKIGFK